MTQNLTLAKQVPFWPWGTFVPVAVLRQSRRWLLRGTHCQHSRGTLSTLGLWPACRPCPVCTWMRTAAAAGRVQTDRSPHILSQACNSGQSHGLSLVLCPAVCLGWSVGTTAACSLLSTTLVLPTFQMLPTSQVLPTSLVLPQVSLKKPRTWFPAPPQLHSLQGHWVKPSPSTKAQGPFPLHACPLT